MTEYAKTMMQVKVQHTPEWSRFFLNHRGSTPNHQRWGCSKSRWKGTKMKFLQRKLLVLFIINSNPFRFLVLVLLELQHARSVNFQNLMVKPLFH